MLIRTIHLVFFFGKCHCETYKLCSNYTNRSQLELQPQETPKESSNFAEYKNTRGKPAMSVSPRLTLLRNKKDIHALKCLQCSLIQSVTIHT